METSLPSHQLVIGLVLDSVGLSIFFEFPGKAIFVFVDSNGSSVDPLDIGCCLGKALLIEFLIEALESVVTSTTAPAEGFLDSGWSGLATV